MTVSVEYASEHLPDLLSALDKGEHIEITRENLPPVTLAVCGPESLSSLPEPAGATEESRAALFNSWRGKIWMADDWDSPEVNAEIAKDFLHGENDEELSDLMTKLVNRK